MYYIIMPADQIMSEAYQHPVTIYCVFTDL